MPGSSRTAGYFFVALYVGLLVLLGIAPVVYAIYLALSNSGGFGSSFVDGFQGLPLRPGLRAHPRVHGDLACQLRRSWSSDSP